jgi:outer membrane protein assembly factor BamB
MRPAAIFTTLFLFAAATASADDFASESMKNWGQWRGPLANGVAPGADPPIEWSEEKNVKWKIDVLGSGQSTPIVWGNRIFLLTAVETERKPEGAEEAGEAESDGERSRPGEGRSRQRGEQRSGESIAQDPAPPAEESQPPRREDDQRPERGEGERPRRGPGDFGGRGGFGRGGFGRGGFGSRRPTTIHEFYVLCYARDSGDLLWKQKATEAVPHEGHHGTGSFASGSPTTDGKRLVCSFGSRGLFCYDLDGKLQWKREFGKMRIVATFGEGASPTLYDDMVILNWDHEGQSFIAALDAATGETKWKVEREERTTWSTPFVVEHEGKKQIITTGTRKMRSYDFASGELLWECSGLGSNPIPTPVTDGKVVFCMSGHRSPAVFAVSLDAAGDVSNSDSVVWSEKNEGPYIASPLLYEGQLYFTKSRNAILSSVDPTDGKPLFANKRLPAARSLYASPVAAAGRIYFFSREGVGLVLKHGPELEVLAQNKLDESIDASPALVGRQMFLRGEKHLYCIEAPKGGE